jgi:DNA-binding MarR family transcriptional regulator
LCDVDFDKSIAVCKACRVQETESDAANDSLERGVRAFHDAGRDLIGIALRSLDEFAPSISLPKFRMLLVLGELGRVPSGRLAAALGVSASSVTRMADRLVDEGLVSRAAGEHSRSVVALELTDSGRATVDRVVSWRHDELRRLLGELEPSALAAATDALEHFATAASSLYASVKGPVAL